jgi:hypothetical protein
MPETSILMRGACAGGDSGYVDDLCLAEIIEVLDRYGRLGHFGVVRLDAPFPVSEDEVMVESYDSANRTLTLRPVTKVDLDGLECVTTRWRLDSDAPEPACVRVRRPASPEAV